MMVKVSEIAQYLICPRQVYFTAKGHEHHRDINRFLEHMMLKELSHLLARVNDHEKRSEIDLEEKMDEVTKRILIIFRDELKEVTTDQIYEARSKLLSKMDASHISQLQSRRITPYEVDYTISSDSLGLVGRIDNLLKIDDEFAPSLIKTGDCPDAGIWKNDRLQLTAYALLVEEEFGAVVRRGFVEYTREADIREAEIKSYDRRKVLSIVERIEKIKDGRLPDRIENKNICENCSFSDICSTEKSLLSKFF
ncbi:MAG: CRISPR-associated protein Cas4 [Halobacteriota archaeon]|nr:CRISPR-associated protein Cas4 [Halobacteriota archaeon]